jgi:hypothetical protein
MALALSVAAPPKPAHAFFGIATDLLNLYESYKRFTQLRNQGEDIFRQWKQGDIRLSQFRALGKGIQGLDVPHLSVAMNKIAFNSAAAPLGWANTQMEQRFRDSFPGIIGQQVIGTEQGRLALATSFMALRNVRVVASTFNVLRIFRLSCFNKRLLLKQKRMRRRPVLVCKLRLSLRLRLHVQPSLMV